MAVRRSSQRRQAARSGMLVAERLEPRRLLATITLQAENGTLTGVSRTTAVAGYTGTGYVTGFDQTGDRVTWSSFAAAPGSYRLTVRFRSPFGDKGFEGGLNGVALSGTFKQSTAFATYDAGLVTLATSNTLFVGGGWNYYEIDAVTLTSETPVLPRAVPAVPVNADATPLARALLARVAQGYGATTLSGQNERADLTVIQSASGKLPAIVEGDLMDYSPSRVASGANPGSLTEDYIALAKTQGYLVSMAWHWNAPTKLVNSADYPWWRGFYTQGTTFDIAATLANPSGADYQALIRDIDAIAVQLKKFAAADVPVLWRPLHESEGGWFWWGAKGPDAFKQLWRLTYDRITNHHGINNLVWVLTSEDPAWYPGDDVVDVVGVDAYPSDRSDTLSSRWSPLLARFDGTKPIALTEFGGVPDIDAMRQVGVSWAYFCSWNGSYGPSIETAAKVQRVYTSAAVVTKDENPALVPPVTPGVVTVSGGVTQTDATSRTGTTPLIKRGPGTLMLTAASTFTGGTVVEEGELIVRNVTALGRGGLEVRAGARVTLDVGYDAASLTGLTIAPAGRVDVGTGRLTITAGGTDATTLRQRVMAAWNGGGWDGDAGLGSTGAGSGGLRAVGIWAAAADVTVGWAAVGDTDLDGFVDALDIANLLGAGRYDGVQAATWEQGDFNYDGIVDALDVADMTGAQLFDAGGYRAPATPPSPPPASPHEVTFAVTNSWPGNFSGSVTIRNRGTTAIDGWTLEFDMGATLTAGNLWGAELVAVSGTRYRLKNASWTAGIAPGGTVSFSFNAAGPATTQMTGKVFNGLPVT